MASNDILQVGAGTFGPNGSVMMRVLAGATAINPGEPVVRALGATTCTAMATNSPVVGTHYVSGIATMPSTQTASANGFVQVQPILPGQIWSIKPNSATAWDTQAEYNALCGKRVLIDLTSSSYTILASDSANNGCVVMPLTISEDPGRVHFAFRAGACDLA